MCSMIAYNLSLLKPFHFSNLHPPLENLQLRFSLWSLLLRTLKPAKDKIETRYKTNKQPPPQKKWWLYDMILMVTSYHPTLRSQALSLNPTLLFLKNPTLTLHFKSTPLKTHQRSFLACELSLIESKSK